jgi:hypothetical protein
MESFLVLAYHDEQLLKSCCADAFFSRKDAGCCCEKLDLGAKSVEIGRNVN